MKDIEILGAREKNLKNISLCIPRNKLVVLTGLSGSGKSTLAMDVLFQECQRQYLEAMGYQGLKKPEVDAIHHVSPAVCITQNAYQKNPRSSVGTVTDIYTELRMLYEKLHVRTCPKCSEQMHAAECREESEKIDDIFTVYQYCPHCGERLKKLTRSHFSFNTREGACPNCEGMGEVWALSRELAVDESLSLEDGAVDFFEHRYLDYQKEVLWEAFRYYGLPIPEHAPVSSYTEAQKAILYKGTDSPEVQALFPEQTPPKTVSKGKFEGIDPILMRRLKEKQGQGGSADKYFQRKACPVCEGERLMEASRTVTVAGKRLPELSQMSLVELKDWLTELSRSLSDRERKLTESYLLDLQAKIRRILVMGLGYLTLDRQTMTLSGGESQRIRLGASLDSEITGIIYILDEPTVGLHEKDTAGIIQILKDLRDLGNTVIVIEHDTEVMKAADYLIDMGPGSGKHGGTVVGQGTFEELLTQETSVTGQYLKTKKPNRKTRRTGEGKPICISGADLHNLKNITVTFPRKCLTSVTGVSGSGKSTLVFDILASWPKLQGAKAITGMEDFDQVITVEQSPLVRMRRSNIATYTGVYSEIRSIFAALPEAKKEKLSAAHFSFNKKGGRCETCEGLGYVMSNLLFFEDVEVVCPDCGGRQFSEAILNIRYQGKNIHEVLKMSVEEASDFFKDKPKICRILNLLQKVGLGYLELSMTLNSLSGGEGQRLKLARELLESRGKENLYLIDEPTTGLHPLDVEHFLALLHEMVEAGNTVIVIEHNTQIMESSDWIMDLGPAGGNEGGLLMAEGTPEAVRENKNSVTGHYLRFH